MVAILAPLVLLGMGEVGVRVFAPRPPSTFFVEDVRGEEVWILDNPTFGYTFFHPRQARLPAQNLFRKQKPAGTIRLLVLGESAAMGFPRPEFGLARVLGVLLQARYPDQPVEVIDATMTMINSHILREIAAEAMAYEPDVVVFYGGNNEVIGPYGPVGVFGRFYPAQWMIRADRWLRKHSAMVGFLAEQWHQRPGREPPRWQGLDHFGRHPIAHDDPRLTRMRSYFRENVRDIIDLAVARDVPVVAATTAVNETRWPPLYSFAPDALSASERSVWSGAVAAARDHMRRSEWKEAMVYWRQAEAMAPDHAETLFGLARGLEALGDLDTSRDYDERAVERDGYRFRADAHIAAILREEVHRAGMSLVDARRSLIQTGDDRPIFLEHVHFTGDGMVGLADYFADELGASLPAFSPALPQGISRTQLLERLFYLPDIDEESWSAVGQFLTMEVFRGQFGSAERLDDVERRRREAANAAADIDVPEVHRRYHLATPGAKGTWVIDELLARYLIRRDDFRGAIDPLQRVVAVKPNHAEGFLLLGAALYRIGDPVAAGEALEAALRLGPFLAEAWNTLGLTWFVRGSREQARVHYEQALSLDPFHVGALNNLGYLHYEQNRNDEAIDHFRRALEQAPDLVEARYHLGLALMRVGDLEEASLHMEDVVRSAPRLARAWSAWGVIHMQQGDAAAARRAFRRALTEDPDLVEAKLNLVYVWMGDGMYEQALPALREILDQRPDAPEVLYLYGQALSRTGAIEDGVSQLQKAIQASPHRLDWMTETARFFFEIKDDHPRYLGDARELAERALLVSRYTRQDAADLLTEIDAFLNRQTDE